MADKQAAAGQAFSPVLAAVATMQGNVSRSEKTQAHEFLEKFQKSVCYGPFPPLVPRGTTSSLTSSNFRLKHGQLPMKCYNRRMSLWRRNFLLRLL